MGERERERERENLASKNAFLEILSLSFNFTAICHMV